MNPVVILERRLLPESLQSSLCINMMRWCRVMKSKDKMISVMFNVSHLSPASLHFSLHNRLSSANTRQ